MEKALACHAGGQGSLPLGRGFIPFVLLGLTDTPAAWTLTLWRLVLMTLSVNLYVGDNMERKHGKS